MGTNLSPSSSRFSPPTGNTDGGLRLLRGVARLGAEDEADLGALHDVPDELADFANQDWRKDVVNERMRNSSSPKLTLGKPMRPKMSQGENSQYRNISIHPPHGRKLEI